MVSPALSDMPSSFHIPILQKGGKTDYGDRVVQITIEQHSGQSSKKHAVAFTVTLMAQRAEAGEGKGKKSLFSFSLLNKEMLFLYLALPSVVPQYNYYTFSKIKRKQMKPECLLRLLASRETIPNSHTF